MSVNPFVLEVCVADGHKNTKKKQQKNKRKYQILSEVITFFNMLPFNYIILIQDMAGNLG